MQIAIEELKQLGSRLIADFNKDREPLEEMKQAINYLDCIIKGEASFKDTRATQYFYDEFLGGISKAALESFHFKNKEVILAFLSE